MDRFDEIHAVALKDLYDDPEHVGDDQWIADAGDYGWCGLTQNPFIGKDDYERSVIIRHRTRVFSLSRADYPVVTQGLIVGRNLMRFYRRLPRDEGCFWRISERPPLKDIR